MSDSEIITKEAQIDTINKITKDQTNLIDACVEMLNEMKSNGKINETTVRDLTSLIRQLDSLQIFHCHLWYLMC